jgi:hypothetical protein
MKFSLISLSALIAAVSLAASPAMADNNTWKKKHPRRAEVNKRDRNLRNRTENAEKSGKITGKQAERLEKEETAIHAQEKADAAANGGHITKEEQRDLNREENKVDRQLRRDERRDRRRKHGAAPAQPAQPAQGEPAAPAVPPANQ